MAGEQRRRRLRALLDLAGVENASIDRAEDAFVHESAASERHTDSNERLEFLGDAVLGLIAADWLFRSYPDEREGTLAKRKAAAVSDISIAATAVRLGFADLVHVGAGERAHGGNERTSILADAFEAFVAVLFREYGLETARAFVEREHVAHLDHSRGALSDPKTQLQEYTQARLACVPVYQEEGRGPAHARIFTSTVRVNGEALGTGTGPSKKTAQQDAAAQALRILQLRDA